ncbi:hypothetical protein L596_011854 [Steinernema carpocapsae]|uniref:Partial AB-hydrolase lipase domain-containing protein n=1 Tax=Steinernema carpocapsae TaxID=34508 RepID=A0A4U5NV94_STECR|nr:hypothetical protein L596_011854 [Steinernema carpocapsae]
MHIILISLLISLSAAVDKEVEMDTIQIIEHWGYPAERVYVTTEDGYILELHHILRGRNQTATSKYRPVVFLQHGLISASDVWVDNLPNQSAGFIFADAGFDVWIGNSRGNTYGRNHTNLDPNSPKFWEFSWDEMAKYDLPNSIDAILSRTKQTFLHYVGHSQGSTIVFARNSEDPSLNANIRKHFALAPVATFQHIKGLFELLAGLQPLLQLQQDLFGPSEFLPSGPLMRVAGALCSLPLGDSICSGVFFSMSGPDTNQLNKTRTPVYISHTPADTSTQNMIHWFQMKNSGKTQKLDYASREKNLKHYGTEIPPLYDISKVNIDTYLFWGDKDWLATEKDIKEGLLPRDLSADC